MVRNRPAPTASEAVFLLLSLLFCIVVGLAGRNYVIYLQSTKFRPLSAYCRAVNGSGDYLVSFNGRVKELDSQRYFKLIEAENVLYVRKDMSLHLGLLLQIRVQALAAFIFLIGMIAAGIRAWRPDRSPAQVPMQGL